MNLKLDGGSRNSWDRIVIQSIPNLSDFMFMYYHQLLLDLENMEKLGFQGLWQSLDALTRVFASAASSWYI